MPRPVNPSDGKTMLRQQKQLLTTLRRPADHEKAMLACDTRELQSFPALYHSTGIDLQHQQRVDSPVRPFPSRNTLRNAANFPSSLGIDPARPITTCSTIQGITSQRQTLVVEGTRIHTREKIYNKIYEIHAILSDNGFHLRLERAANIRSLVFLPICVAVHTSVGSCSG